LGRASRVLKKNGWIGYLDLEKKPPTDPYSLVISSIQIVSFPTYSDSESPYLPHIGGGTPGV
jgi:hypothetical protein